MTWKCTKHISKQSYQNSLWYFHIGQRNLQQLHWKSTRRFSIKFSTVFLQSALILTRKSMKTITNLWTTLSRSPHHIIIVINHKIYLLLREIKGIMELEQVLVAIIMLIIKMEWIILKVEIIIIIVILNHHNQWHILTLSTWKKLNNNRSRSSSSSNRCNKMPQQSTVVKILSMQMGTMPISLTVVISIMAQMALLVIQTVF